MLEQVAEALFTLLEFIERIDSLTDVRDGGKASSPVIVENHR